MFEIWKIIKENQRSFYDYSTGVPHGLWLSGGLKALAAAISTLFFTAVGEQFLGAILTAYSILIGFSFGVLFQIIAFNSKDFAVATPSLEREARVERLQKLADELFYNVSYFNLVSLALVIITLCFFMVYAPEVHLLSVLNGLGKWSKSSNWVSDIGLAVSLISKCIFYLLLIESIYSLLRIVGRLSVFFERKIALQNAK